MPFGPETCSTSVARSMVRWAAYSMFLGFEGWVMEGDGGLVAQPRRHGGWYADIRRLDDDVAGNDPGRWRCCWESI